MEKIKAALLLVLIASPAFAMRSGSQGGGGGISSISTNTTGAGSFIFNQDYLQTGATFYVSSGTVYGPLRAGFSHVSGSGLDGMTVNTNKFSRAYRVNILGTALSFPGSAILSVYQCPFNLDTCVLGAGIYYTDSSSPGTAINEGLVIGNNNVLFPDDPVHGSVVITSSGTLVLGDADSSKYVSLRASDTVSANYAIVLPAADGTAAQVVHTNGAGAWYFADDDTGGGGSSILFVTSGTSTGFVNTVSSPTGGIVAHQSQIIITKTGGSTAFMEMNLSSITAQGNNLSATFVTHSSIATTSYLPTSVAAATYVTQSSVATTSYLPTSVAAATYILKSSGTIVYTDSVQTITGAKTVTPSSWTFAGASTVAVSRNGLLFLDSDGSNHAGIRGAQDITTNFYTVWMSSICEAVGQVLEVASISASTVVLTCGLDSTGAAGSVTLVATQTWSGGNNWTTPLNSTFTYGLVAGTITVNGTGPSEVGIGDGGNSTNYHWIRGPTTALTENLYTVLPSSRGVAGQTLGIMSVSNSSMTLHWDNDGGGGGSPGGSDTQFQYNNGGSFGGTSSFQYYDSSNTVTISSFTEITNSTFQITGSNYVRGLLEGTTSQIFTTTGTYTPSANMEYALIRVIGGGGASQICDATDETSGGGGGGGYVEMIMTAAQIGANAAINIGGASAFASVGTDTTFNPAGTGPTLTGSGGSVALSTSGTAIGTYALGGAGGTATGGGLMITGERGGVGYILSTLGGIPGDGGNAGGYIAGGGRGGPSSGNIVVGGPGFDATSYGGGAGGCNAPGATDINPGAPAAGVVYVQEFW